MQKKIHSLLHLDYLEPYLAMLLLSCATLQLLL